MKTILIVSLVALLATLPASPQVIKEYIRLNNRVVAVESNAGQVAPTVDGASPETGSGSGPITFTFSDFNGATDFQWLWMLIPSGLGLDGYNACYLDYQPSTRTLRLWSDTFAVGEQLVVGSSSVIGASNSRCQVNGAGTSVQTTGNTLTLTVNFTFKAPFIGRRILYAAALDNLNNNSGWQSVGVRYLPQPPPPANVPQVSSLSPSRITSRRQTVTMVVSDPNGAGDLNVINLLINSALDGQNACFLAYVRPWNMFFLVSDDGGGLIAPSGSPSVAANRQCRLYGATSSAAPSGNALNLNFDLEFLEPRFNGNRIVFGAAGDLSGNNSGWQVLGTLAVQQ
jgi:hypothetical protein